MCGIFGYIGNKSNASQIVLEGLKSLEYRGYDSWGIAIKDQRPASLAGGSKIKNQNKLLIEKRVGKVQDVNLKSSILNFKSNIGIGHTRWATHGGVTDANAHPHLDCTGQIALIHNGIVENFQELKSKLVKKDHKFASETDTEVISHLIEEHMKKNIKISPNPSLVKRGNESITPFSKGGAEGGGFKEAVRKAFNQLKGLNAIVAININSNEIIAAKNGSPLIAGIGNGEYFLASDAAAILPYTRKMIFLKDNELISLNSNYKLYSLTTGKELKVQIEKINWNIEQVSLGKFRHFMLKEIYEQGTIINMLASTYTDQIAKLSQIIKKARGTFFIGCGTAYHACLAGTYLFSKIAKLHVNTTPASEFNYLEDFLTDQSLIVVLSQSGETIDAIEPLTHAQKKDSKIMSITNSLGSTIYRMSDYKLLLGAGPEKAVASTKTYIAKLTILTMLAYAQINKLDEARNILTLAAKEVNRLLDKKSTSKIKTIADLLSRKEHIYIIGRGVSYATALEGALKIKEVSYIHTEGLSGGELKHGTIALVSKGTPCIVIAPLDETYDAIISNAIEIKSRGGYIIGISSKNNPVFDEWIEVRETNSPLITHVIPIQLLAYYLAIIKNLDPDKPRNLAKSVTVK